MSAPGRQSRGGLRGVQAPYFGAVVMNQPAGPRGSSTFAWAPLRADTCVLQALKISCPSCVDSYGLPGLSREGCNLPYCTGASGCFRSRRGPRASGVDARRCTRPRPACAEGWGSVGVWPMARPLLSLRGYQPAGTARADPVGRGLLLGRLGGVLGCCLAPSARLSTAPWGI